MKQLVEVFQWLYEGEFTQNFFAVDDEEEFIKEMNKYLNTVAVKTEYPWSDPLYKFRQECAVAPYFLGNMEHLKTTYFLDYNGYGAGKFTITKRTVEYKNEDVKFD